MRKILLLIGLIVTLEAQSDVYHDVCVKCHKYQPATLEKMFLLYLKTYSVEISFKVSLKEYLENPTEKMSLIDGSFIDNYSVKNPTDLNSTQLDEALDTYWDLYNPKDNLE